LKQLSLAVNLDFLKANFYPSPIKELQKRSRLWTIAIFLSNRSHILSANTLPHADHYSKVCEPTWTEFACTHRFLRGESLSYSAAVGAKTLKLVLRSVFIHFLLGNSLPCKEK